MDRRLDRGHATRALIIATATRLFAERGYDRVSIDAVLQATGLSRGALYHHFAGKDVVFAAVLEATEARVAEQLSAAAASAASPLEALRAGCVAWLQLAASDAAVRQIVLTDAPSVLGWRAWRDMDARYGLGLLKSALQRAAGDGIAPETADMRAHLLLAMVIEGALMVAQAADPASALRAGQAALDRVLPAITS